MALVAKYSLPVRASKRASTTRSMWDERNAALLTSPWTSVTQSNPSTVDIMDEVAIPKPELVQEEQPVERNKKVALLCKSVRLTLYGV